jgi:GT2 family glycosyltransferase
MECEYCPLLREKSEARRLNHLIHMQILVLGMHRSGASMVARLLNMMGAYFAPEGASTGANQENPKGFWERRDVRALNDMVLHSAGADWHRLSHFTLEKIPAATLAQFEIESGKLILAMDAHRPWFLKEPRFCLLAPIWLELLEFPVCVFVNRSPLEVAQSLEMRNGFSLSFGLALWERYNTEALNATRAHRRIQINRADLMADPVGTVRQLQEKLETLGVRGLRAPSDEEIRALIDPSLYRAKATQVRARLSPAQQRLHRAIETGGVLRSDKTIEFSAESQEVLSQHDRWIEAREKTAELDRRNAVLVPQSSERDNKLEQSQKELQESKLAIAQLQQELEQGSKEFSESQKEVHKLSAKISQQAADLAHYQRRIEKQDQQIQSLQKQLKEAETRWKKDLTKLVKWSDRIAQDLGRLLKSNRWRLGCWLSLKRSGRRSKEAQRFAHLVATRPRPSASQENPVPTPDGATNQGSKPRQFVDRSALERDAVRPAAALTRIPEPPPESQQKSADATSKDKISEALSMRIVASAKNALPLPPRPAPGNVSICFIVLHHSGEHHLRNLFSSFLRVNTLNSVEFRLVLHACTDGSREVVGSFQSRLPIKVTDCDDNHSFAYSNNRAAEATSAEYLVFLNNDIVFQENAIPELLRCLQDRRNGVAGVRLVFPPDRLINASALQHGGIKFRPDPQFFFHRPFNVGLEPSLQGFIPDTPRVLEKFPAVTGALAMCRRSDFLAVGGFCEKYSYGYEDVDLCLSFRRLLGLRSVSANHVACIHDESATRRLNTTEELRQRRLNNTNHLVRRHGWYLRREILAHKMAGGLFFSDEPLTAAFAVTASTPDTAAGDFYTASELARACRNEFGWKIRYLSHQNDWYDLEGVDVLVVLIDSYEPSKIRRAKPDLAKVAWMRNWFERWVSRPDFDHYDLYLCSSIKSARWLREAHRKPAWVFPLATNPHSFAQRRPDPGLSSDYCFTGSYWRTECEIETAVQPEKLEGYKFAVFGKDWEAHPTFGAYTRGFRPYSEMPVVYSSTRVVVDDANSVTKEWGSVNSRVFDALVAGALVITNGETGAAELFDQQLPTYKSPEELQSLLRRYLSNEEERRQLAAQLRERVLSRHTYRHRARSLKRILIDRARRGYRIAFKIGAPGRREAPHWGDYHFAQSLGRYFAAKGHSFRIDCLDEWERPECFGDDVVIVLRGLSRYRPKPGQINLMWNISHPDKIEDDEYEEFDHVFVASQTDAEELSSRLRTSVSALLECPAGEGVLANHTFAQQAIVILEKIRQLDSLKQKMEGLRNARAA